MTAYHVIVLLIIVSGLAVAAWLFPRRPFLQFFAGLAIALAVGGILALALYVYFLASGEA